MKSTLIILGLITIILFSCQKEISAPNGVTSIPTLTTTAVTSITATTAAGGGNISTDGGATVTARGVCWSTTTNPIITGTHTTNGTGTGAFTSAITGLTSSTVYYARAYATNSMGTAYGNEISFTTTTNPTALATLTTTAITAITTTTASGGGNITADGGASITARGVCWGTSANPVVTGSHTTDGTGTGIFTSSITGLTAGTIYHVRAYATNTVGTAYGGDSSFTTSATAAILPTVTTATISLITSITATSGGNVTADGGATVTARGVCWSTTANPTIALSTKTTDGTGTGIFISNITGLTKNTTYHVRAYATNSVGTAYGNDASFTTDAYTVYVAGYEDSVSSPRGATVWKNGVRTILSSSIQAAANSVFVTGNDVYVAGSNGSEAVIWKNGVSTVLASGIGGGVNSIFVDGNDVYATGICNCGISNAGILWKNGVQTVLNNGFLAADPQSVFVAGSNAYVAGYDRDVVVSYDAKVWINSGVGTILAGGNNGNAAAFSVFVSGSDVYVAGYEYGGSKNLAMLWKNGVPTVLSNGTYHAYAQSVYIVGSNVYVAGYETQLINDVAVMWKNGVRIVLSVGTNEAFARSIFVFNGDVYVAGEESSKATLWKNGVATVLNSTNNYGTANSVFVQ